jgi:hypothetical protein
MLPDVRGFGDAQATTLLALGMLELLDGRPIAGRSRFDEAHRIAEEIGQLIPTAAADWPMCMGMAELVAGDPALTVEVLRWSVAELERVRDLGHLASVAPLLAQVLLTQGDGDDEVDRLIELGRRVATPADFDALARILLADAMRSACLGRADRARRMLADARSMLRPTDMLLLQYETETTAVRVSARLEDGAASESARSAALELAHAKGSDVLAHRALAL